MSQFRFIPCSLVASALTFSPALFAADELNPTFPVPAGLRAEAFAHEPMFANPVAVSVDVDGSVYVAETRRRKANRLDIRDVPDWLNYDLSFTNVENKEAFLREKLSPELSAQNKRRVADLNGDGSNDWRDLTALTEVIHKLRDTNGDGRADQVTTYADGFNTVVTGVAAGLYARGKDVYATIEPDLWQLRDNDGDGRVDERKSLVGGFAVHIAYAGHNMHGVTMGPDGRLYWSVGDIASNYLPNEGAIFRSNPDGSNFEVFARGLRNPEEIVFNELGDLFAADNDSDNGDRERWLHIVEGADYGWRNWWQYQIGKMWGATEDTYPMWNAEGLWHLWFPEQSAWVLPPAAYIGPGPCGMKFYPGGALDDQFGGRILLAEFTGSPGSSTINRFTLKQHGATYDVTADEKFLKDIVATGIDFAPDGSALFVADWAGGWDLNNRGRVWKVFSPTSLTNADTLATRKLLQDGFDQRPDAELINLLGHHNLNVRREAQFALAAKGTASVPALTKVATSSGDLLQRIHALWGLEQINRKSPGALMGVTNLLSDSDSEIRAQSARMMGDGQVIAAGPKLIDLLQDSYPRVEFAAAQALAKLRDHNAITPIEQLLARHGKQDRYLRYAGIHALEKIADVDALLAARNNSSADVRIASTVALRRLERPEVAEFLKDADPLVVADAARAINDVPIQEPMPKLAALIQADGSLPPAVMSAISPTTTATNDFVFGPIARRALNANFRLGKSVNAERLGAFAANTANPSAMRREAVRLMTDWEQPNPRDQVVGAWRPLTPTRRDVAPIKESLNRHLAGMIDGDDNLRADVIQLASTLGIHLDGQMLLSWVQDPNRAPGARINALEMLAKNQSPELNAALGSALNPSANPAEVYGAAVQIEARRRPENMAAQLDFLLRYRLNQHLQQALAALSHVASTNLDQHLVRYLNQMTAGELAPQVCLDVVSAAEQRKDPAVQSALAKIEDTLAKDPLGKKKLALTGGDPDRGRKIFFEKSETQCLRCHKVSVNGRLIGGDAAPDLTGVGKRSTKEYLLTSIVNPNAAFAPGYEQVVVTLKNGTVVPGRVLSEDDQKLVLEVPIVADEEAAEAASAGATSEKKTIQKSNIANRERGLSGMPEGFGDILTPFELRDLVAFLANQ